MYINLLFIRREHKTLLNLPATNMNKNPVFIEIIIDVN